MEAGPKLEVRPTILVCGPALACAARAIRAVIDSVVLGLMTLITHELLRAGSAIPSSMSWRARPCARCDASKQVPRGRSSPASAKTSAETSAETEIAQDW